MQEQDNLGQFRSALEAFDQIGFPPEYEALMLDVFMGIPSSDDRVRYDEAQRQYIAYYYQSENNLTRAFAAINPSNLSDEERRKLAIANLTKPPVVDGQSFGDLQRFHSTDDPELFAYFVTEYSEQFQAVRINAFTASSNGERSAVARLRMMTGDPVWTRYVEAYMPLAVAAMREYADTYGIDSYAGLIAAANGHELDTVNMLADLIKSVGPLAAKLKAQELHKPIAHWIRSEPFPAVERKFEEKSIDTLISVLNDIGLTEVAATTQEIYTAGRVIISPTYGYQTQYPGVDRMPIVVINQSGISGVMHLAHELAGHAATFWLNAKKTGSMILSSMTLGNDEIPAMTMETLATYAMLQREQGPQKRKEILLAEISSLVVNICNVGAGYLAAEKLFGLQDQDLGIEKIDNVFKDAYAQSYGDSLIYRSNDFIPRMQTVVERYSAINYVLAKIIGVDMAYSMTHGTEAERKAAVNSYMQFISAGGNAVVTPDMLERSMERLQQHIAYISAELQKLS